jgi:hypothetical protein
VSSRSSALSDLHDSSQGSVRSRQGKEEDLANSADTTPNRAGGTVKNKVAAALSAPVDSAMLYNGACLFVQLGETKQGIAAVPALHTAASIVQRPFRRAEPALRGLAPAAEAAPL